MRLLIIEDNVRMAGLLSQKLSDNGFVCDSTFDLASASVALSSRAHDAVLLDLGLPDGDGLEWIQAESRRAPMPPTLILTARNGLYEKVAGLDAGADDYLAKPFDFDELLARLRALLRRPGLRRQGQHLESGLLRLNLEARSGFFDGSPLDLSQREADLLELLLHNAGTVVTREAISAALYDGEVTPNAIEAIVSRVRRKIELLGGRDLIHTVRGLGYLLRSAA